MMYRYKRVLHVVALRGGSASVAALALLLGCGDDMAVPTDPTDPTSPGVVLAAAQAGLQSSADTVTYVSMSPGTVADGVTATATDFATGLSVMARVADGGFDPVPLNARAGDAVQIVVTDAVGDTLAMTTAAVPPRRPPVVVRTVPPRGGTDVPLNALLEIVFSEPIAAASLTPNTLQLLRDGSVVPGSTRFLDAEHLRATFVPTALLAAETSYELNVTTGIQDLTGDALEASATVSFATGTSTAGPIDHVEVTPLAATLPVGSHLQLTATARDADGNALESPVTWASLNPSVATVSATGLVTGVAPGSAQVFATSGGGKQGIATITVEGTLRFASVIAGGYHACGVTSTGAAYCWGSNDLGQAGNGQEGQDFLPLPSAVVGNLVFAPSGFAVGDLQTCGLTMQGAAYCWGAYNNTWGELGIPANGGDNAQPTPQLVTGGHVFASLSAGELHTCGVVVGGQAYCWGYNASGELGDTNLATARDNPSVETQAFVHFEPVAVNGGITFTAIGAGAWFTCGLATSGVAHCWGDDSYGQLGDGSASSRAYPEPVAGGYTFVSLSVGARHACALTAAGTAYCWGFNAAGALGDGTTINRATPTPIAFDEPLAQISAGVEHTCALTTSGQAYCWGDNDGGPLGDSTSTTRLTPTPVFGGLSFASVSAGGGDVMPAMSCGMTTTGVAYCWGFGGYGQMGNGTTNYGNWAPVKVGGQQ